MLNSEGPDSPFTPKALMFLRCTKREKIFSSESLARDSSFSCASAGRAHLARFGMTGNPASNSIDDKLAVLPVVRPAPTFPRAVLCFWLPARFQRWHKGFSAECASSFGWHFCAKQPASAHPKIDSQLLFVFQQIRTRPLRIVFRPSTPFCDQPRSVTQVVGAILALLRAILHCDWRHCLRSLAGLRLESLSANRTLNAGGAHCPCS